MIDGHLCHGDATCFVVYSSFQDRAKNVAAVFFISLLSSATRLHVNIFRLCAGFVLFDSFSSGFLCSFYVCVQLDSVCVWAALFSAR